MNTLHFKCLSLFIVSFFIAASAVVGQQSDFQIQYDFQMELNELMDLINEVNTTEELAELEEQIQQLEEEYAEHSAIISSAMFPETFEGSIERLHNSYSVTMDDLTIIERYDERIEEMAGEMDSFRQRITDMNLEVASLEDEISRSVENEARQAELIREYRQNIEQRNFFVSEFLEELMSRYQTMDPETQAEVTETAERLDDNPLEMIETIVVEYINLADRATALETPDYVAMRAQHGYFKDIWDVIGERLANTFEPQNPVAAAEEIDGLLASWLSSVDNQLWDAMNTEFVEEGIVLPEFSSPEAFTDALNTYVDNAYELSLDRNSEEDEHLYRNFSRFWNSTVKASWGDLLVEGNAISQAEIAAIDLKVSDWGTAAAPVSNLMLILFIISLAVIIGLIVMLITMRRAG